MFVPGKFNSGRDKLFFFFSEELLPQSFPNAQNLLTTPTTLERAGDFSQTLDQNKRLIVIRDPVTGAAFPGNIVPAARIDPSLQKLLGVFPAPELFGSDGVDKLLEFGHLQTAAIRDSVPHRLPVECKA